MNLFARRRTPESEAEIAGNLLNEIPRDPKLTQWTDRLKRGAPISDSAFDEIYPLRIRKLSKVHWTPIEVIRRAVGLFLDGQPDARVLDVGSGVGKFCLVGALISSGKFTGIEQREHFFRLSRELASLYRIPRVSFLQGNFEDLDWSSYQGIYLFNPFQENKTPEQCLDHTVPLSREIYREYVFAAVDKLARMPKGTRVITYHGFGGAFPQTYVRKLSEWCYRGPLELWIKSR